MKTQLYNLPRPMLCDVEKDLDADGFPTMKAVREYMDLHSGAIRRLKYLSELYVGRHDILRAPDKEAWKPDNRLVVNFPRYITNISLGYGYGVPITKRFTDEKVEESIQQIEKRNHIIDHENQLFKKVFQMGHAWEFFYQNESAQTRMKVLTPMQFFCVYDDTLEERSVFAVRYGKKKDGKIYGEVYTREYQRKFLEGNWKGELEVNPYGLIPAVEYMLNDERMGLYEDSAPLIEAYNRTLSEKTNDVDAFAEAYLAIIGTEVDSNQVRRIRDERVINIFGTDNADEIKNIVVQFLTKPTADATQENLLNRLERLIFQISMSANISDDSFGNVASGEAMAYKLLATGTMLSTFDTKISKSLQKRYKILCSLSTNSPDPNAWEDVEIQFHRNIPKNTAAEIENAKNVSGMVSQETQLSLMPSVIPDVAAELERIAAEQEDMRAQMSAYGNFGIHTHDEDEPEEGETDETDEVNDGKEQG